MSASSFSLSSVVSGNWSTHDLNTFTVLYFIRIPYNLHFQSLLLDKFLDIYITSPVSARIEYQEFNFTIEIKEPNSLHPYGYTQINDKLSLDLFFITRDAAQVSIIDKDSMKIYTYGWIRPEITQITYKEWIRVIGFILSLLFFVKQLMNYIC